MLSLIAVSTNLFQKANASTVPTEWSWTKQSPTLFSSTKVQRMDSTGCRHPLESRELDGQIDPKKMCITEGSNIDFGFYYDSWWRWRFYVSFGLDQKMYQMNGPCENYNDCLYLPGTDTLAVRFIKTLKIYKNFKRRLHPMISGLTRIYKFDDSNPDYVLKADDGYEWPIGAIGSSADGRWLGVEIRSRSIGLLDIEKLQMKLISDKRFEYGYGHDASAEIDVSNDGKHLVITGQNAGFAVYDINDSCGQAPTDFKLYENFPMSNPCKMADIVPSDYIDRFDAGLRPIFSEDGGQLDFYLTSFSGEVREVSLRAGGYPGQRIDYIALGDSFTSGEGENDDKYYLAGTNEEFEKCHVSSRSYPFVLAGLSNIQPEYVKNVACSGAKIEDVTGSDYTYLGQGKRLGSNGLQLTPSEIVLAQTEARMSFMQGRIPQKTFVKLNSPKVITVGIGGNDAGLMQKLNTCLGTDICNWVSDPESREQTAYEIKSIYPKLVKMYQDIQAASTGSRIYAIGYPKVIDENGRCGLLVGKLLDPSERRFMNESISYLNQVIEAATKTAGVRYVDIQDSFGGQALCGSKSPSVMNDIRVGDDTSILGESNWFRFVGQESFHPNSNGYSLMANRIYQSSDFSDDSVENISPIDTPAPEPSGYWSDGVDHNYSRQSTIDFTDDDDFTSTKTFALPAGSFEPNSSVNIEITSEPIGFGNFAVADDGSFNASVTLPDNLSEGYHTLHIYGATFSGEQVELYDVIKIQKPITDEVTPDPEANQLNEINNSGEGNDSEQNEDHFVPSSITENGTLGDLIKANIPKGTSTSSVKFDDNDQTEFALTLSAVAMSVMALFVIFRKLFNRNQE